MTEISLIKALLGIVSTLGILFFSASFPQYLRKKFPILKIIDGKKGWLIVIVVISTISYFLIDPIYHRIPPDIESISSIKDEGFPDSTFNVLILPFNKIQVNEKIKLQFERALEIKFSNLKRAKYYTDYLKSKIRIKYYPLKNEFLSIDSIKIIAANKNADIALWGDLYESMDTNKVTIKYLFLNNNYFRFDNEYNRKTIQFTNLFEVSEGNVIKDFDFIVLWVLITKLFIDGEIEHAKEVLGIIEQKFSNIRQLSTIYLYFGQHYYFENKYSMAKEYYEKSLNKYPLNAQGLNHYAVTLINGFQDTIKALPYLKMAVKIAPNNFTFLTNYINILYGRNEYNEVLRNCLAKAIKLEPKLSLTYGLWGQYYLIGKKNIDSAIYFYHKAKKLDPKDWQIFEDLGIAHLYKKNYKKAEEYFNIALSMNSTAQNSYYSLAATKLLNGVDTVDVKDLLVSSIKYGSENPIAYRHLGYIYYKINKLDSAIYYLEKSKYYKPQSEFAYLKLAKIYKEREEYLKAKQNQFELVKKHPQNGIYLYNYGYYLNCLEMKDSSAYYYKQSIKYNRNNGRAHFNLANYYYFQKNDIDSAEILYKKSVKLLPQIGDASYYLMALKLNDRRDTISAKKYYLDAIRIDSSLKNSLADSIFQLNVLDNIKK